MPDGIFDGDFIEDGTVVQLDGNGIPYRPLLRVVILGGETFVLDTGNLGTESVDSGVSGGRISATWKSVTGRGEE